MVEKCSGREEERGGRVQKSRTMEERDSNRNEERNTE
jgi:hypothetical protein